MPDYARTQADVASKYHVSRQTVAEWCRYPDFPKRTKKGWNLDRVNKWLKDNGRGPERKGSGGKAATYKGMPAAEVRVYREFEQAENERIKKERQQVEQAAELKQILYAEDVLSALSQMVATVTAVHDTLTDAIDRALPEQDPSDQETYTQNRERVMQICEKLKSDVHAAMEETL